MKLQIFVFLYIFGGFLNFVWYFFFGEKLAKPCQYAKNAQLVSQQSLASIIDKNSKILTTPPIASTNPSGMNAIIGALVYRGIPFDLRFRPEQSHHLP